MRRSLSSSARPDWRPKAPLSPATPFVTSSSLQVRQRGSRPDSPARGWPSRALPPGTAPDSRATHPANGDIFDPSLFTAASKELPLGSWLYVQHQGKGVVVYVNDRGPYVDDRVLDLSQAAAETIGITGLGWIRATIIIKV